ncbi:LysE family translocator [Sansalvadorimonas verongulae]|uniref:LysE family translocator n=1 Tax=Sansalvadorimonas verongulae TaxID=2172824 RepID=UPI0012BCF7C1|nr:LysE family translocator [Sansalvadorimonas verongulae]MTI12263.1 LysE family translocator [Sansalvadorimonas verongulae]
MTLTNWLPLAAVCVLGACSPGPSLALVINNTVKGGKKGGVNTAVGHGFGVAFYALLTVMGLGVVIVNHPILFASIQYLGAAFLLYKAVVILRSVPNQQAGESDEKKQFEGFVGGFLVAVLNPKIVLFFLALFSQFIRDDLTLSDQLTMTATASIIDIVWYVLVAMGIGGTGLLHWLQRNSRRVDCISAVIFIALAGAVVIRNLPV